MPSKQSSLHTLRGPLRVSVRKEDGEWYARAIDFGVLGIGDTPEEARRELLELVHSYFIAIVAELRKGNKVHFFNPTPEGEYDADAVERYEVEFTATCKPNAVRRVSSPEGMEALVGYIDTLEDVRFAKCAA